MFEDKLIEETFKGGLFVINLDRRPNRYEDFCNRFPFDKKIVKRFSAIDGNNLIIPADMIIKNKNAYACRLSHLEICRQFVSNKNLNDEDYILVFEDDSFFCDNFKTKFIKILEHLHEVKKNEPNVIYIGGRFEPNFIPEVPYLKNCFEKLVNNFYLKKRQTFMGCNDYDRDRTTHCLIYNKKAAERILKVHDYLNPNIEIDTFLNWIYYNDEEINLIDAFPHLCYSPVNYETDIQQPVQINKKYKQISIRNGN